MNTNDLSIDQLAAKATSLRQSIPLLSNAEVMGHPLVYLDSGATSQRPEQVLDAEHRFLVSENSAVHRGAHTLAALATESFEDAREKVASFIGAQADELIWTSGATESLNLLTYSMSNASEGLGGAQARRFVITPGDSIVVTEMEHHANLIPWQQLCKRTGAQLRFIPVDDTGTLQLGNLDEIIDASTKVVAFMHVSNVIGQVTPIAPIIVAADNVGAIKVLDACQSVPHFAVDVSTLGVDFLAFSGHKMLGPNGIGGLWGRAELLEQLPPFLTGGSMITHVDMDSAEFLPAPMKFEAGTKQVPQAIGLAAATDILTDFGMQNVASWESYLGGRMADGLSQIPGVTLIGPKAGQPRTGIASFTITGVHAHDVGQVLDAAGIAVRVGHHCAQPLHRALGITASVRASAYAYNTVEDVDKFLAAVATVPGYFGVDR